MSTTQSEILDGLYIHQQSILAALDFHDGKASKKEIRAFAKHFRREIPHGSVYHHFDELEEQGLIEQVGETPVGRGGTSHVYELTPLGTTVAPDTRDEKAVGAEDIQRLADQVEENSEQIEEIQETVEEIEAQYNKILTNIEIVRKHLDI